MPCFEDNNSINLRLGNREEKYAPNPEINKNDRK